MKAETNTKAIWSYDIPLASSILGILATFFTSRPEYAGLGVGLGLVMHILGTIEQAGPPPAA